MKLNLSREQTIIMRGLAITFIALHNFCHVFNFTIDENESSFRRENADDFFNQLGNISGEWVYNLFSFLGWYGVPVFVFLTAFGLVRKYEAETAGPLRKVDFLYNNWVKLFALFLPAAILIAIHLCVIYFLENTPFPIEGILKIIFSLSFLNDLVFPFLPPYPVIYWYFGLTLEFYFLYAFAVYKRPLKLLLIITLASIILQYVALPGEWNGFKEGLLRWVRFNITGWLVPFTFGIIYARARTISTIGGILTIIASFVMFLPTMINPLSWQVSLLCAIIITILIAIVFDKIPYWNRLWIWIGKLSPFIFTAHPLVRLGFLYYLPAIESPRIYYIAVYFIAVIICAVAYRQVWKWLTPPVEKMLKKAFPTTFLTK